jgi:hypothetical protein
MSFVRRGMGPRGLKVALVLSMLCIALSAQGAPAAEPAGLRCIPPLTMNAGRALPVGASACPGVRPGALIETPVGGCTLNFLFAGSDRNRYIGTAGHCFLGEPPFARDVGEVAWAWPRGPIVKDANGVAIGRAVYAVLKTPKDFALIRLFPKVVASPAMCHFGGPTSGTAAPTAPQILHYYGNGLGISLVSPARSAVATHVSSPDHVYAQGVVIPGDSGGAIIDDAGRAVGVVVSTGLHEGSKFTDKGMIGITRLQPQVARAAKVLRLRLTLRTAPLV